MSNVIYLKTHAPRSAGVGDNSSIVAVIQALDYFAKDIRAAGYGLAADLVLMAAEEIIDASRDELK
jgi:hypothetical protein